MTRRREGILNFAIFFFLCSIFWLLQVALSQRLCIGHFHEVCRSDIKAHQEYLIHIRREAIVWMLVCIVTGVGLCQYMSWSRWLVLVGNGAFFVRNLLFVKGISISDKGTVVVFYLLLLSWQIYLFWYFLRPGVKAQFVRAATSDK